MALTRGVRSLYHPPPGLRPICAPRGALRPALPPTCPSTRSRAAPTDGSCGSQRTEHKAQLTRSSLLFDGEASQGAHSSTPRPSPRVRVSRTFSVSAQPPSPAPAPAPGAPRWLGSQSLRRPRVQDRRTTCGWPTPPASRGLRWARRGLPRRRSHSQRPRLSPGRPSPTPRSHPDCGRTLPAWEEPGSGFQILRTDTKAPSSLRTDTHPSSKEGKSQGPGALPPHPCPPPSRPP